MTLRPCAECGHQVSDRAAACPSCGAPVGSSALVAPQLSVDEWTLVRLTGGSPRRQVVDELVQRGPLTEREAEALVKRVEDAALAHPPDKWASVRLVASVGVVALILLLTFLVL